MGMAKYCKSPYNIHSLGQGRDTLSQSDTKSHHLPNGQVTVCPLKFAMDCFVHRQNKANTVTTKSGINDSFVQLMLLLAVVKVY